MRVFQTLALVAALSVTGLVAQSVSAAPCNGSGQKMAAGSRVHAVRPAVLHERIISSRVVREVALADEPKDIVDTAVGAGTFKTLAAALGAAGLVDTLKGNGPFTVFAPTDEAFA